jgi:small subunit ribosomal protein S20
LASARFSIDEIVARFAVEIPGNSVLIPAAHPSLARASLNNEKVIHVANIKSQIKRIGTNKKAEERNKALKSELKTAIRATHKAVAAGDKATAATTLTLATKKLDKAVSKGVIHKNQAANRKSAIAKQVAAL